MTAGSSPRTVFPPFFFGGARAFALWLAHKREGGGGGIGLMKHKKLDCVYVYCIYIYTYMCECVRPYPLWFFFYSHCVCVYVARNHRRRLCNNPKRVPRSIHIYIYIYYKSNEREGNTPSRTHCAHIII